MNSPIPEFIHFILLFIVFCIVVIGIPFLLITTIKQFGFSYNQTKYKYIINGGILSAYFIIMFVFIYDNIKIFQN